MRVVVQRVSGASVSFEDPAGGPVRRAIGKGLVLLLGVGPDDTPADAQHLAAKVAALRIFADDEGRFNRALLDVGGEALVVSQFTLYADASRGRRPSFIHAAEPEQANRLYETFAGALRDQGVPTSTGSFGARMTVSLDNDGPVTLVLSTDAWPTQL
jgi:D-tyrosyl-tRNA(Tyr) deacylase